MSTFLSVVYRTFKGVPLHINMGFVAGSQRPNSVDALLIPLPSTLERNFELVSAGGSDVTGPFSHSLEKGLSQSKSTNVWARVGICKRCLHSSLWTCASDIKGGCGFLFQCLLPHFNHPIKIQSEIIALPLCARYMYHSPELTCECYCVRTMHYIPKNQWKLWFIQWHLVMCWNLGSFCAVF